MLRLDLAQYRELAALAQFATELDKTTQSQLNRGEKMVEILKQPQYQPMDVSEQIMIIFAGINGYLDDIETNNIKKFENEFLKFMREKRPQVGLKIKKIKEINEEIEKELKNAIEEFKKKFSES
jgi:F-type H+-transporting ATPase subunit alpha